MHGSSSFSVSVLLKTACAHEKKKNCGLEITKIDAFWIRGRGVVWENGRGEGGEAVVGMYFMREEKKLIKIH